MDNNSGQTSSPVLIPSSRIARYAAFWLDGLILAVADILLEFVVRPGLLVQQILIRVLLTVFYFVVLTVINGQTLGKRFFGVKVVNTDGNKVGLGRILLRETLGRIIVLITFSIGYLWIIWDKNRQGWHDKIAGTRVIQLYPLSGIKKAIAYIVTFLAIVLLALGILSIIFSLLLLFIPNPLNKFGSTSSVYSQSNNTKRRSDVNAIWAAIGQYSSDKGITSMNIKADGQVHEIAKNDADICLQIVPTYMARFPEDPKYGYIDTIGEYEALDTQECAGNYDSGYQVMIEGNSITVSAPNAELGETISVTR